MIIGQRILPQIVLRMADRRAIDIQDVCPADTRFKVLVFTGDDATPAEAFAGADPYVREGLVRSWEVRPWTVVIGG